MQRIKKIVKNIPSLQNANDMVTIIITIIVVSHKIRCATTATAVYYNHFSPLSRLRFESHVNSQDDVTLAVLTPFPELLSCPERRLPYATPTQLRRLPQGQPPQPFRRRLLKVARGSLSSMPRENSPERAIHHAFLDDQTEKLVHAWRSVAFSRPRHCRPHPLKWLYT